MLGVVSVKGARLDAGSAGLAMAKLWAAAGRHVLFIDAATVGEPLAGRAGPAMRAEYRPEVCGLPTLIAARQPLTLSLMAEHCFNLDAEKGSLWALFGPDHPEGRRFSARWLEERVSELSEIDRQRTIILASSLQSSDDAQVPLLKALPALAYLAPAGSREEANSLRSLCDASGLLEVNHGGSQQQRALVIDSDSAAIGDNEAMGVTKLYLEGRLPQITEERLLRLQRGRKDREFIQEFEKVSERLWQLSNDDEQPAPAMNGASEHGRGVAAAAALTDRAAARANGSRVEAPGRILSPSVGEE